MRQAVVVGLLLIAGLGSAQAQVPCEPDCSIGEAPTEVGRSAVLQGTRAFQRQ